VDGIHLESRHRLHEAESRVQVLLRGTHGEAAAGYGARELSRWIPSDVATAHARRAAPLEEASNDICEFDERPISQGCAGQLYPERLWTRTDALLYCSVRHDGTAIAVCALDRASSRVRVVNHRLFRPEGKDIDFAAVEQELIGLAKRFNLASVYFDPFQAESLAQRLRTAGVNMTAFPQTSANLIAAASNLLSLVQARNLTTYPSEELRTAIANCITIESARGYKLAKTVASRKIDLAAALSFAALAAVREGGQRREPGMLTVLKEQTMELWRARHGDGAPAPQPAAPAMASAAVEVQGCDPQSNEWRVAQHFRQQEEQERRSRGAR
jgi:hypothetical protein